MVSEENGSGEVVLAGGASASTLFHHVLAGAVAAHPAVFEAVDVGASAEDFKKRYSELVPGFEAARADSPRRSEVAATLADSVRSVLAWHDATGETSLAEHLARPAELLRVESQSLGGSGSLRPRVPHGGADVEGAELVAYARGLVDAGSASEPVAEGIGFIVEHGKADGIDLRGRRVAVLGAAAELAPTRLWLQGGADVLWIDTMPPPVELLATRVLSGTLHWAPEGADVLTAPRRVMATIEAFAGGSAVDLGLYAYAPGNAREWRLTGTMNAIVDALPAGVVRSVTTLVSATTCGVLTAAEVEGEARRRRHRPRWQATLDRMGLLGNGRGHVGHGDTFANRGIVPIQGTSYQAAQYLGKLIAAEAWAAEPEPPAVSANTAGISRTVSLRHPVFDTAFAGAEAFGIETFDPPTTAALNGLLTLRDWLDPGAPGRPEHPYDTPGDRARALTATRVHGGVYEFPYPLEPALRVATAFGVAKDPRRIGALVRRG